MKLDENEMENGKEGKKIEESERSTEGKLLLITKQRKYLFFVKIGRYVLTEA
jgi:hypothetical protein